MEDFVGEYGFSLQELAKSPPSATTLSRLTEVHKSENLEILLKNTCQMKCHYCNADFSSAWEKENLSQGLQKKQNKPDVELRQQFHQAFWQYLPSKLAKIKELSIIGGEPLLQKEFYDLLDKISEFKSDLNSQRLRILVISNLSVSDATMERFLSKVESLRDSVDFYLLPSIDSTGARAEYVRTGLDWNLFQRNLDRAFSSELFSKIRFIVTMSAFNVSDLSNLLQFFYDKAQRHPQQKIELIPNIVAQPEKMSPLILDASFAPYLKEALLFLSQHPISSAQDQKIFYDFIENLYQTLQTQDQNSLLLQQEQFRQWIQKYDGLRSTDFLHTHPEFKLFFKGPDDPVVRV